jgi:hypothetical protein
LADWIVDEVAGFGGVSAERILWFVKRGLLPFRADSLRFDEKAVRAFFPAGPDGKRIPKKAVLEYETDALRELLRLAVSWDDVQKVKGHDSPQAKRLWGKFWKLKIELSPLLESANE